MSDPAEPLSAEAWAANVADMLAATELEAVEWAGPIEDVPTWLAENQRLTVEHGDPATTGYCVQSDGIIIAFTGTGPHAAAYAELIAYLINGARPLLATLAAARQSAPATEDEVTTLRQAATNLSDRRTLMNDGFWVSRKEMRALDAALATLAEMSDDGLDHEAEFYRLGWHAGFKAAGRAVGCAG